MSHSTSKPMTYERLGEVLTDLAFVKKDGGDFVAYYNGEHDALVVLPLTNPGETLSTWHLLAVRKALTEKRVASAELLEQRLKKRTGPHVNGNGQDGTLAVSARSKYSPK